MVEVKLEIRCKCENVDPQKYDGNRDYRRRSRLTKTSTDRERFLLQTEEKQTVN